MENSTPYFSKQSFRNYLNDCIWKENEDGESRKVQRNFFGKALGLATLPFTAVSALFLDVYYSGLAGRKVRQRTGRKINSIKFLDVA